MSLFTDPRWGEALAHLPDYLGNHVRVSVTALALGLAVSLPLAILSCNRPVLRGTLLGLASIVQTVPGLALLALFYPLLLALEVVWFRFLSMYVLITTLAMSLMLAVVLAGIGLGAAVAWLSAPGKQFLGFAFESWIEVKKVVWPTRKETIQTTAAVFAFVLVMAVFLWISDKTLEWVLYDLLLGWKKT